MAAAIDHLEPFSSDTRFSRKQSLAGQRETKRHPRNERPCGLPSRRRLMAAIFFLSFACSLVQTKGRQIQLPVGFKGKGVGAFDSKLFCNGFAGQTRKPRGDFSGKR